MNRTNEVIEVLQEVMELDELEQIGDDNLDLIFVGFRDDEELEITVKATNHVYVDGERANEIYLGVPTAV